jgi:hypothetical protein
MHAGFWWESQIERDRQGVLRGRWDDNIKMDLREIGCVVRTELIWHTTPTRSIKFLEILQ